MESNYEVFLKADLRSYMGKWIAIANNKVVAVGDNSKEVYEKAQKIFPNKKVMLIKVPEEEAMIF